ncbi:hypothetical protein VE03_01519 [Pseudogymnoascus sp. 23342-1-I1]|nr:hypothetical protein VE03_01519 [Pseudogymnoascus sp. 23342-1-I1]
MDNFNMVTVLLPMWDGQIFTESMFKGAPKYSRNWNDEKIGVARQIVAKGKKVELSQAVIKYGVEGGDYASLVYLIEHQVSINIDRELLEWVSMHGKQDTADVFELFLRYSPRPDALVTSTFMLLLINSMGPTEESMDLERVDDVNDSSRSDGNGGKSGSDEGDDAFIDKGESESAVERIDVSETTNGDHVGYDGCAGSVNDDPKCDDEEGDEEDASDSERDESDGEEGDNGTTTNNAWFDLDLIFDLLSRMSSCSRDDAKEIARSINEKAEKAQYLVSEEDTQHLYKMLGYHLEPNNML